MDRWNDEWQRLYAVREDGGLVDEDGRVRAGVLELGRPADWRPLSQLWQGVQADLGWPAPGIAVNGSDGYQLWFSLPRAVPAPEVEALLRELVRRYLLDAAPARLRWWPRVQGGQVVHAAHVPRVMPGGERWSAFVAPDLAAVFGDEAALDLPPGNEAQAELLARLQSIQPDHLARVQPPPQSPAVRADRPREGVEAPEPADTVAQQEPRQFLLAVMNDASVDMALRIEAAKALLDARA